jgi:hypothetical protein
MMLSKSDILEGLRILDEKARAAGQLIDLSIYGGAALAIAFDMRQATRDVDAVVNGSPDFLRAVVVEVAAEKGWPDDWLNDGVKGFRSANERMSLLESFQGSAEGGLRVSLPAPEYLFAMKCMAMRPEGVEGSRDISDIEGLARICSIKSAAQALDLVESFYPSKLIPPKVRFGVEEIMERIAAHSVAAPAPPTLGGGLLSPAAPPTEPISPSTQAGSTRKHSRTPGKK